MKSFLRRLRATALAKAKENRVFPGLTRVGWGNRFAMDAKTSIKKRLQSRHVTEGPERAPHRSYLYAMGLTTQQIHQPFVGLERGRALQYLADAAGPGGQEGRRLRRRHPPRVLHHHRDRRHRDGP